MLRNIISPVEKYYEDPDSNAWFDAGEILQLEEDGEFHLSDGTNPAGILFHHLPKGIIIFTSIECAETDIYWKGRSYKKNDLLYVNGGIFTTVKSGVVVGKVLDFDGVLTFECSFGGQKEIKSNGMACIRCKEFNEYATSNQVDGSFKCYGCRR